FSSRRRHTRSDRDWSSDVCSSDLRGEEDGVPEDDLDIAAPPVGARRLPRPIEMIERRDLADLQLHRHHWGRTLDGDEPGPGLERLHRPADRELALRVDEHRELTIEPRAQKLKAAADGALAREGERVGEDGRRETVELVAEDIIGGRGDRELPPP